MQQNIPISETMIPDPEDRNKICRFCLKLTNDLYFLNSSEAKYLDDDFSILKILNILSIEIDESNFLPQGVCEECITTLKKFLILFDKIKTNEEILKNVYSEKVFNGESSISNINLDHAYSKITEVSDCNTGNIEDSSSSVSDGFDCNTDESLKLETDYKNFKTEFGEYQVFDTPSNVKIKIIKQKLDSKDSKAKEVIENSEKSNEENIIKQCPFCEKKFINNDLRILHYVSHVVKGTEDSVTHRPFCTYCGVLTADKDELEEHINLNHDTDDKLVCEKCDIQFSDSFEIEEHEINFHIENYEEAPPINQCLICNNNFENLEDLLQHSLIHISRRYTCRNCKKIFICDAALNEHLKQHPNYKNRCPICNKLVTGKRALESHLIIHDKSEKNFMCDICGNTFKLESQLRYHKKKHFKAKLICSFCGYSTILARDLNTHLAVHSKERKYQCTFEDCGKAYKTNSALSSHVKQHLNIKNFNCNMCDYKTNRSVSLTIHKRKHTGEKPYPCEICLKKFTRRWNLSIHLKSVHKYGKSM